MNIILSIFMFFGIIVLLFLMYLIYQMLEMIDTVVDDWINLISGTIKQLKERNK